MINNLHSSHKLISHYEGKLFECHCESVFKTNHNLRVHQRVAHVIVDINCQVICFFFENEQVFISSNCFFRYATRSTTRCHLTTFIGKLSIRRLMEIKFGTCKKSKT